MLHLIAGLIPAPLHRLLYRVAHSSRKRWLRWRGGEVHGCSVIARDAAGRVLLVRHSYGSGLWSFPGGGINRGEEPAMGAAREFSEELRCGLTDLRHLGTLDEQFHGARNVAHVFTGDISGEPRPDMREIVEARFFGLDDLPENRSRMVDARLELLR